jgi:lipoprotein Spr
MPAQSQSIFHKVKFIENIQVTPSSNTIITTPDTSLQPTSFRAKDDVVDAPETKDEIEKCYSIQFKYALLLDREVENITNLKLYFFIESWFATQYRYGGTSREGIDCSAFTSKLVSSVFETTIPRTAREQYAFTSRIDRENLQEGDLVFFNTRGGVSHVGFYLGNNYFVHSSVHGGVKISSLTESYYNRKFIGGGRIQLNTNSEAVK